MNFPLKFSPKECGFTVIEVLVAFTILALSVGVLSQIFAKGTTNAILGEEYAIAGFIADSKLAELDLEESFEDAVLGGIEDDKYHWQILINDYIEELPTERPLIALKEITLTVNWQSRGKQRNLEIQTLRPAAPNEDQD